jgi:uncharacterized membrane protein
MNQTKDLGEWLLTGRRAFGRDAGRLAGASFLTLAVTAATGGLLAGPMLAGLALLVLGSVEGDRSAPFWDVFKGFDYFMDAFPFVLLYGAVLAALVLFASVWPLFGIILLIPVAWFGGTMIMFGLFLMVDRRMDFVAASRKSFDLVRGRLGDFLALGLAVGSVVIAGAALGLVGLILTLPLGFCLLAAVYRGVVDR